MRGSQTHLIDREHGLTDLVRDPRDDALADEIRIRHDYDWIDKKFDEDTRAKDLSRGYSIRDTIENDWSTV